MLPDYLIRRGASLEQGDRPMGTGLLVMEIRTNIESLKNTVCRYGRKLFGNHYFMVAIYIIGSTDIVQIP